MQVTTVGLDLAKNIFQVYGVTDSGEVAFNRALRRSQVLAFFERLEPCLIRWRPVAQAITGHGNFSSSAMTSS